MARVFCGAVLAVLVAWADAAGAQPDKRACLATYVEAQSERQEGKLLAARAAAVTCGSEACPDVLRNDCVAWLRELDASIPTVVFSAATADGRDVAGARITVDGHVVAERAAGEAVAMDPGEHLVACDAEGYARVEMHLVAAQGTKNRSVHFTVRPLGPSTATLSPDAPVPGPARPIRPLTYVLGAVGVVGLGVWGVIGSSALWGTPSVQTLDRCKPNCDPADRSDVHTKLVVADLAGAAAVVALGSALALYVTRPSVVIAPMRDGLVGTWTTRF
jgi:hypothetical protein